jgi:NAD dependent epimerase/dehydratase family enzyme
MELTSLSITRQQWGAETGKLKGEIKFKQANGDITLILSDEQMAGVLNVCAPAVVTAAQEVATMIYQEALEVVRPITVIENKNDEIVEDK